MFFSSSWSSNQIMSFIIMKFICRIYWLPTERCHNVKANDNSDCADVAAGRQSMEYWSWQPKTTAIAQCSSEWIKSAWKTLRKSVSQIVQHMECINAHLFAVCWGKPKCLCNAHTHHFCEMHFQCVAFSTRCALLSICLTFFFFFLFWFQQKNETQYALEETYDVVADGFNDTYMSTIRPTVRSNFHNFTFYLDLNLFDFRRPFYLHLCLFLRSFFFEKNVMRVEHFIATIWFASIQCYVAARTSNVFALAWPTKICKNVG